MKAAEYLNNNINSNTKKIEYLSTANFNNQAYINVRHESLFRNEVQNLCK